MKTCRMACTQKNIMNESNSIIEVLRTSIALLIFMSGIFFMYLSNEGCFTLLATILYDL